jgi:glycosyltransferase involved in cell wall biosynthesis
VEKSGNPYLLSVIIPISKMAGRLKNFECTISNICREKDIQIIIIHDLQDSETSTELANFIESQDKGRIIFIEKYLGSPGAARNLGLNYVSGSWINFVDSDDIYYPMSLMKFLRRGDSAKYSAIISNYETIDEVTKTITLQKHDKKMTKIALRPGIWRWAFRANSLADTKFSELSMGEDQKFLYQFCQEKRNILFIKDCTYRYTINHKLQLTNQKAPKRDLPNAISEILKIRMSHQSNFDEFTESMFIKLCLSNIIYAKWSEKIWQLLLLLFVALPVSSARLRLSKLRLRDWY